MATKIESDVSGSMWKLIAQPGDMVEAEAEIAIIESMKMEIPVIAPRAGKLARFLVAEGEAVAEGQIVAEIE
ncbi:MAG TPA: acetyl-CoA carboxylase biotin carboxyl carrier protein subunit [Rhodoblastus sp.]|nr:acetyl-CoA carboxylase biotin carboxyl carrier protein subunit [Rhodoblastus sp.]